MITDASLVQDLYRQLVDVLYAAPPAQRAAASTCWVMDRPWYDRIRAAACTQEQELERARAHARVMINAAEVPPYRCPVCTAAPFGTMQALAEHVRLMADPENREPATSDILLGIPLEVRAGGGFPHLVTP